MLIQNFGVESDYVQFEENDVSIQYRIFHYNKRASCFLSMAEQGLNHRRRWNTGK